MTGGFPLQRAREQWYHRVPRWIREKLNCSNVIFQRMWIASKYLVVGLTIKLASWGMWVRCHHWVGDNIVWSPFHLFSLIAPRMLWCWYQWLCNMLVSRSLIDWWEQQRYGISTIVNSVFLITQSKLKQYASCKYPYIYSTNYYQILRPYCRIHILQNYSTGSRFAAPSSQNTAVANVSFFSWRITRLQFKC